MISLGALIGGAVGSKYFSLRLKANLLLFSGIFMAIYYYYKSSKKRTIRNMFKQSIEIQQRAIKHYQPDIIVGSSWGGAVSIGEYNLISSLFNLVIGGLIVIFYFRLLLLV